MHSNIWLEAGVIYHSLSVFYSMMDVEFFFFFFLTMMILLGGFHETALKFNYRQNRGKIYLIKAGNQIKYRICHLKCGLLISP